MNGHIRSPEVSRIVQALSGLPGSEEMNVISKRFPRFGPAESASMYEERSRSFRASDVPEAVSLPPDVDELIIVLTGVLSRPEPQDADRLLDEVADRLGSAQISPDWDVRAHFAGVREERRTYELMVFTNSPPPAEVQFD